MILHTEITGQGQAIVLIHGLFGSYENLGVIARALAGQWQVVNLDMRNHGRSGWHDNMSYALMAEDIKDTLDHLGLDQVVLLGHSMGGYVALELKKQHRGCQKVVLLNSNFWEDDARSKVWAHF